MARLYTFGCSFTRYKWPTWADLLAQQYDSHENWGLPGAGNLCIFNSIIECLARNIITPKDKVIVMWSTVNREDRYVNGEWQTVGNIYNQSLYDVNFVANLVDERGYLIRDLALIQSIKYTLEYLNIDYDFLSMMPLVRLEIIDGDKPLYNIDDVTKLYKETLKSICPSIYETVFKNDWYSKSWKEARRSDIHPLPSEHLEYLRLVYPKLVVDNELIAWANSYDSMIIKNEKVMWAQTNLPTRL